MRKSKLSVFLVLLVIPLQQASGGEYDKLQFGLVSGLGLRNSLQNLGKPTASMGLFVNYALSRKLTIGFELEKSHPLHESPCNRASGTCFFESLHRKDWSQKIALNYHFNRIGSRLLPYVGVGAGNYYILDSKARIKQGRRNRAERNLDYELKRSFKRPGFFAAFGLKWQSSARTTVFLQTKTSILFERSNDLLVGETSNFTELLNMSTGILINLN
ncbi:MAG: hypothetical protein ACE5IY_03400 [bacterium]